MSPRKDRIAVVLDTNVVIGYYHDSAESLLRDERKNRVFALGGVPLIRLRPTGRATQEEVQARIGEALREIQDLMLETERKNNPFQDVSPEMDFKRSV